MNIFPPVVWMEEFWLRYNMFKILSFYYMTDKILKVHINKFWNEECEVFIHWFDITVI